ncbi:hypothetical protein DITRI_Ditri10aG0076300 [Diplodiscus trichospermus]
MYFPSTGRNLRPRGFNVKLAFQLTLTLAICIWLLYQIKNSNYRKNVRSLQTKFSERNGVVILGRKGDVELSDKGMYTSDSNDVILEAEGKLKDRGGGDDELDGNVDEKVGNESSYKGTEYSQGHVKINGREERKKMEPAVGYNLSADGKKIDIEMRDMDKQVLSEDNSQAAVENSKRIVSNREGGGGEKNWKNQITSEEREHESGTNLVDLGDEKDWERNTKVQKITSIDAGKDGETGSSKENGEDKELASKEITKQVNGAKNATFPELSEVASGLHGFHDETGVPQGGSDLVEFTLTKSRDGQTNNILRQQIISDLNHPSEITKSFQIEEVASKSDTAEGTQSSKGSKE